MTKVGDVEIRLGVRRHEVKRLEMELSEAKAEAGCLAGLECFETAWAKGETAFVGYRHAGGLFSAMYECETILRPLVQAEIQRLRKAES